MNLDLKVPTSLMIHGNINGLVQVINNMISNAIQAYKGKEGQTIDLIIAQEKMMLLFLLEIMLAVFLKKFKRSFLKK